MVNDMEDQEPPREIETDMPCPVCGAHLFLIFYATEIPYEGEILIQTQMCKNCFYKNTSIQRTEGLAPIETSLEILDGNDLNVVVYRSPGAKVSIPEIGVEIEPGTASNGDITTVEGLLMAIRDQMIFISDSADDEERFSEIMETINSVLDGRGPRITIHIDDPKGISKIVSYRAVTRGLN
jgi:zinc finger protein